jgi:hypothetical protein
MMFLFAISSEIILFTKSQLTTEITGNLSIMGYALSEMPMPNTKPSLFVVMRGVEDPVCQLSHVTDVLSQCMPKCKNPSMDNRGLLNFVVWDKAHLFVMPDLYGADDIWKWRSTEERKNTKLNPFRIQYSEKAMQQIVKLRRMIAGDGAHRSNLSCGSKVLPTGPRGIDHGPPVAQITELPEVPSDSSVFFNELEERWRYVSQYSSFLNYGSWRDARVHKMIQTAYINSLYQHVTDGADRLMCKLADHLVTALKTEAQELPSLVCCDYFEKLFGPLDDCSPAITEHLQALDDLRCSRLPLMTRAKIYFSSCRDFVYISPLPSELSKHGSTEWHVLFNKICSEILSQVTKQSHIYHIDDAQHREFSFHYMSKCVGQLLISKNRAEERWEKRLQLVQVGQSFVQVTKTVIESLSQLPPHLILGQAESYAESAFGQWKQNNPPPAPGSLWQEQLSGIKPQPALFVEQSLKEFSPLDAVLEDLQKKQSSPWGQLMVSTAGELLKAETPFTSLHTAFRINNPKEIFVQMPGNIFLLDQASRILHNLWGTGTHDRDTASVVSKVLMECSNLVSNCSALSKEHYSKQGSSMWGIFKDWVAFYNCDPHSPSPNVVTLVYRIGLTVAHALNFEREQRQYKLLETQLRGTVRDTLDVAQSLLRSASDGKKTGTILADAIKKQLQDSITAKVAQEVDEKFIAPDPSHLISSLMQKFFEDTFVAEDWAACFRYFVEPEKEIFGYFRRAIFQPKWTNVEAEMKTRLKMLTKQAKEILSTSQMPDFQSSSEAPPVIALSSVAEVLAKFNFPIDVKQIRAAISLLGDHHQAPQEAEVHFQEMWNALQSKLKDLEVPDDSFFLDSSDDLLNAYYNDCRGTCRNVCPYCRSPCLADHRGVSSHSTSRHFMTALGGWRDQKTGNPCLDSCCAPSAHKKRYATPDQNTIPLRAHQEKYHPSWEFKLLDEDICTELPEQRAIRKAVSNNIDKLAELHHFNPFLPEDFREKFGGGNA